MRASALTLACLLSACAGGNPGSELDPMAGDGSQGTGPVAVAAPTPTAEDSLADEAALDALHDFEFKSLA